jgi:DNA invertase Pin-like site-specific DNA recombinase
MLIGYARVSTDAQDLEAQRIALIGAGVEDHARSLFQEKISGAKRDRPELARMLAALRPGDVVVVRRLDRLARSTRDLLDIVDVIKKAGAGLKSLAEPWADSTSPSGEMILTVFAGIAQFERSLILARTGEGRKLAQARGVRFGRPPKYSEDQWDTVLSQVTQGNLTAAQAAKLIGCNRATVFRKLAAAQSAALARAA